MSEKDNEEPVLRIRTDNGAEPTVRELVKRAKQGDEEAKRVLSEISKSLKGPLEGISQMLKGMVVSSLPRSLGGPMSYTTPTPRPTWISSRPMLVSPITQECPHCGKSWKRDAEKWQRCPYCEKWLVPIHERKIPAAWLWIFLVIATASTWILVTQIWNLYVFSQ